MEKLKETVKLETICLRRAEKETEKEVKAIQNICKQHLVIENQDVYRRLKYRDEGLKERDEA
eukprot:9904305-Karenia_brevis.AAC.1